MLVLEPDFSFSQIFPRISNTLSGVPAAFFPHFVRHAL